MQQTTALRTIYVLGHIRPDADSICAAIGYANLKNRLGYANVRPGRTGPVNPQTRFVLDFFGVPEPMHVEDLHVRVADLLENQTSPATVPPTVSLREVGDLVRLRRVKTLPVLNRQQRLLGLVTVGDIAEKCLEELANPDPVEAGVRVQQLLEQPVGSIMRTEDLVYFTGDDLIADARRLMLETRFRNYPVLDEDHRFLGLVSRYHLLAFSRKQVILVDHNEKAQAVPGIENAEILEIIDHHRLGDLQTGEPIMVRSEPVGSTCTLVAKLFLEQGMLPEASVAGLLCAGILSDTVLFKSPTVTALDRELAREMARIAGINLETFGRDLFRAAIDMEGRTAQDLFFGDFKEFGLGDERVGISQLEVTDLEILEPWREDLKDVMDKARQYNGYDLVVLMITDLLREGTELLVEGKNPTRIAQAFRDYGGIMVEPSAWAEPERDRFAAHRPKEPGAETVAIVPEGPGMDGFKATCPDEREPDHYDLSANRFGEGKANHSPPDRPDGIGINLPLSRSDERDSFFLPGVISRKKQVVPVLVKYLGIQRG